jgi:diketogulonate reductase-like aldo/keto reductase
MILEEKYTLSNGIEIPKLGLGKWFISDKDHLYIASRIYNLSASGYNNDNHNYPEFFHSASLNLN